MVEAFLFDGPDESFRVGVEIGASCRQFHWLYTGGFQNIVELVYVQRISVVDQALLACQKAVLAGKIASDLLHPWTIRLWPETEDLHLASGQIDGKEHHASDELAFDQQLNREEVTRSQNAPVALDELFPGCLTRQVRFRIIAVLQEDVLDCGFTDLVSDVHEVIPDSRVAPARILLF